MGLGTFGKVPLAKRRVAANPLQKARPLYPV